MVESTSVELLGRVQLGGHREIRIGIPDTCFTHQLAQAERTIWIPIITIGSRHEGLGKRLTLRRGKSVLIEDGFGGGDVLAEDLFRPGMILFEVVPLRSSLLAFFG